MPGGVQRLLAGLQVQRQLGMLPRRQQQAAAVGRQSAYRHETGDVHPLAQAQQQRLALLGNIRHPGVGGCRPQQRHIQQRRHRSGRVAIAVRQLVDEVRRRIVIP